VIFSIPLEALTLLNTLNPLRQPAYAASAPTSGYNRGCSDAQISNPADRYINQPENGPGFHSKAFLQAYNEGYNSCTTQQSNNISSSPLVSPDTVSEAPSVNPGRKLGLTVMKFATLRSAVKRTSYLRIGK
jgi:hypothetical protein